MWMCGYVDMTYVEYWSERTGEVRGTAEVKQPRSVDFSSICYHC